MSECTCGKCQKACENKPGWFLPGEAERVAEYLSVSLPDLFATKLGVDWWEADERHDTDIYVLSPAITSMPAGDTFPSNPNGRCVFYQDGRCSIHPVKPYECRAFIHDQSHDETTKRHEGVADAWAAHQQQVKDLFGEEPEKPDFTIFDLLSTFGL